MSINYFTECRNFLSSQMSNVARLQCVNWEIKRKILNWVTRELYQLRSDFVYKKDRFDNVNDFREVIIVTKSFPLNDNPRLHGELIVVISITNIGNQQKLKFTAYIWKESDVRKFGYEDTTLLESIRPLPVVPKYFAPC